MNGWLHFEDESLTQASDCSKLDLSFVRTLASRGGNGNTRSTRVVRMKREGAPPKGSASDFVHRLV